jgi:hypothetical protein
MGGGGGGGGASHVGPGVQSPDSKTAPVAEPSVTLTWFDDVAPAPSITLPPDGAVGTHPTLHGQAGTALGDGGDVALDITTPGGTAVQTLSVPRDAQGAWSTQLEELAPGTYVALVAQSDWAGNAGRGSMTFRVEAASVVPTPTLTPTSTPAPPHAKRGMAPATGRIQIRQARLVRGTLRVRLKCAGPAGKRCAGRLTLTAKRGKRTVTLGSAPYRISTGRTSTVRVHPRRPLPRRATITAGKATRTITVR